MRSTSRRPASPTRRRFIPVLLSLALLAVSCGQLPGARVDSPVAAPGADRGPGASLPGDDDFVDLPPGEFDPADPGAMPPRPGAPRPGGPGPGNGAAANGEWEMRGTDRTGVTADTIHLGAHAPVTGAAPLPSRSFETAADLYWKWLIQVQGETVLGRTNVEVTFADDRYQPSAAVQQCRQLSQRVFALAGAGGTDQIQACARFANSARVPYASAGVTEAGIEGLEWYFAFSMTYRGQGPLLAQYVRRNFPNQKVAAIVTDTPNFDDAVQGWEQGVARENLNYYRTLRHPRGDTSWYDTMRDELQQNGVEVLFILTSPLDYIRFAQQANGQGFRPQYVGVGISKGLNPVLGDQGCPHVNGGIFFSPFPGLDWARDNVPEFFEAAQRFGVGDDDLAFAMWGQARSQHAIFERYEQVVGTDLTREDFRDFLSQQQNIRGGIFPEVSYTWENRFGANQVHVLRADCASGEHVTVHTFASSF